MPKNAQRRERVFLVQACAYGLERCGCGLRRNEGELSHALSVLKRPVSSGHGGQGCSIEILQLPRKPSSMLLTLISTTSFYVSMIDYLSSSTYLIWEQIKVYGNKLLGVGEDRLLCPTGRERAPNSSSTGFVLLRSGHCAGSLPRARRNILMCSRLGLFAVQYHFSTLYVARHE